MEKGFKFDIKLILLYLILVIIGIMNIYSSICTETHPPLLDASNRAGMQTMWFGLSAIAACAIMFLIKPQTYDVMSWLFYALALLMLAAVLAFGVEVNGSRSWINIGGIRFQPAEISKITTALLLSSVMSRHGFRLSNPRHFLKVMTVLALPMMMILMEKEAGTMLVYLGFAFVLYMEGMSGWILTLGGLAIMLFVLTLKFSPYVGLMSAIAVFSMMYMYVNRYTLNRKLLLAGIYLILVFFPDFLQIPAVAEYNPLSEEYWLLIFIPGITALFYFSRFRKRFDRKQFTAITASFAMSILIVMSVDIIFNDILKPHQRDRIENLLGIKEDIYGAGYNVHQSKIAIGSGGFFGKGYLKGTQTKFDFVPEQSTDFIFCTVGEEWGFTGSVLIIILFAGLITRILNLAGKSRNRFTEIYGYCTAAIIFMHFMINIGMTIGLVPVIGIPLPFISYGGTSLLSFTVLLFIFIRLESETRR